MEIGTCLQRHFLTPLICHHGQAAKGASWLRMSSPVVRECAVVVQNRGLQDCAGLTSFLADTALIIHVLLDKEHASLKYLHRVSSCLTTEEATEHGRTDTFTS